jgi:hypothetical protein
MKMKKIMLLIVVIVLVMVLSAPAVLAGSNNQNGSNGKSSEMGTNRVNNLDGCRPDVQSGNRDVFLPGYGIVDGGPCCPSNIYEFLGEPIPAPAPNQCCNPPDSEPIPPPGGVPGNHCLCFLLRGVFD